MKFKDYAQRYLHKYDDVTFIVAKAVKDEHTPFYHSEYVTTPICLAYEWVDDTKFAEMNILNDNQCPIDWLSGASWRNSFKSGRLKSLLVISDEDIKKMYSEKQAQSIIDFCERHFGE